MIVIIPPDRSATIREIRATERDDGNYSDVSFLFHRGPGERHRFVVAEDLGALINSESLGRYYWNVFRHKYKSPERIEEPALCGAWLPGDDGQVESVCNNAVPCETHREKA